MRGDLWDLAVDLEPGRAARVRFRIRGVPVMWDDGARSLTCARKTAPLPLVDGRIRVRVLVDRTSLELSGNDGAVYMPMGVIPKDDEVSLDLYSDGGTARVRVLTAHALKSVWR